MSHDDHEPKKMDESHEMMDHSKHEEKDQSKPEGMDHSKHEGMDHSKAGGSHRDHHAMMELDFKRRFYVSLIITGPILVLSPTIQQWFNFTVPDFPGYDLVLFGLATITMVLLVYFLLDGATTVMTGWRLRPDRRFWEL